MRTTVILVLLASLVSAPALAGSKGKGKGQKQSQSVERVTEAVVTGLISAAERAIVSDYIAGNRSDFAGAEALPPGIAKKLARGGRLPPGIAKKRLPGNLETALPRRPDQEWLVIGTDLVVVKISTNTIVDILKNVL